MQWAEEREKRTFFDFFAEGEGAASSISASSSSLFSSANWCLGTEEAVERLGCFCWDEGRCQLDSGKGKKERQRENAREREEKRTP
jgi:hypothetical protein